MKIKAEKRSAVFCPNFGHYVLADGCGRGCKFLNFRSYEGREEFVTCAFVLTPREKEEIKITEARYPFDELKEEDLMPYEEGW
jgi:hypothetical protein